MISNAKMPQYSYYTYDLQEHSTLFGLEVSA